MLLLVQKYYESFYVVVVVLICVDKLPTSGGFVQQGYFYIFIIMKRFYWSGISNDKRIKAISEITDLVDRYATILNFQRFSDISLRLLLEVEECKIYDLQINLKNIMYIEDNATYLKDSKTNSIIHLHITFTQGTGDLNIKVPEIPG